MEKNMRQENKISSNKSRTWSKFFTREK